MHGPHVRAVLADGEGGARVAPVALDPGHEVAEHEVAVLDDAAARRAADLRRAQAGHEVGQHGQPGASGALHLASDGRPQLELGDSRLGVRQPPAGLRRRRRSRHGSTRPRPGPSPHGPSSPTSTHSSPAASATGSAASIATREPARTSASASAAAPSRTDPEARVGDDLTARRHRSFGLVVADDEHRSPPSRESRWRSANGLGPDSISGASPVSHVTTDGCATRRVPAPAVSAIVIAFWLSRRPPAVDRHDLPRHVGVPLAAEPRNVLCNLVGGAAADRDLPVLDVDVGQPLALELVLAVDDAHAGRDEAALTSTPWRRARPPACASPAPGPPWPRRSARARALRRSGRARR